eukprot:1182836-Amphidinium_carterae.1
MACCWASGRWLTGREVKHAKELVLRASCTECQGTTSMPVLASWRSGDAGVLLPRSVTWNLIWKKRQSAYRERVIQEVKTKVTLETTTCETPNLESQVGDDMD